MSHAQDRLTLLRLRATLADALCVIDQGLPGAARVTLPSALDLGAQPSTSGYERRRHLPSDYARVGGRGLKAERTEDFTSPWWRDTFRPGAARELSMTCCHGQKDLCRTLNVPAYHVDICDFGASWKRVKAMKRRHYGAGHFRDGRYVEDRNAWQEWFLGRMSDRVLPSPNSPVTVTERGLVVRLPDGCDAAELDAVVKAAVSEGSLAAWLRTEEGRSHCRLLGVDPAVGQRFTAPPVGSGDAPEPVEDIVMRSQQDTQARLIHVVEQALLAHQRLLQPEPA